MNLVKYNAAGQILQDEARFAPQGAVFSAYAPVAQSIPGSVFSKLLLSAEEFDPFGWFDSSILRFQPTVPGYYRLSGAWENGLTVTAGQQALVSIYKNGVEYKRGSGWWAAAAANQVCQITAIVYLNGTTDYVELYAYSASATQAYPGLPFTYFQGELVAASVGVAPEPWHIIGAAGEPAFQSLWAQYSAATVAFFKDPHGIVRFKGAIVPGTVASGTPIFSLPAGYRPTQRGYWPLNGATGSADVLGWFVVDPGGAFKVSDNGAALPTAGKWDLQPISFRAEQ